MTITGVPAEYLVTTFDMSSCLNFEISQNVLHVTRVISCLVFNFLALITKSSSLLEILRT